MSEILPLQDLSRFARTTALAALRRKPLSKASLSQLSRNDRVKQHGCGKKTADEISVWAERLGIVIPKR